VIRPPAVSPGSPPALDPAEFPGAPPEILAAGSMVFVPPPGPVDLRHLSQWWRWTPGASWRRPHGPGSSVPGPEHTTC
jgi:sulfatase modifying factor 1